MLKTRTITAAEVAALPIEDVKSSRSGDVIQKYLTDESGSLMGSADCIFFPLNEEETSSVMAWANREKIPVTLSGGGTGITGSRVPQGGVVIATDLMTKVREIPSWAGRKVEYNGIAGEISLYLDPASTTAVLPAGITLADMMAVISKEGLYYPPYPTEWSSLIGGNVATNASGGRSFRHGAIRKWIKRLRVVLPTGHLLEVERGRHFADESGHFSIQYPGGHIQEVPIPSYKMPSVKNASGLYTRPGMDLIDLFIGSEGILGAFTEVEMEMARAGDEIFGCILFFPSQQNALGFVKAAREKSRNPQEIIEADTIDYFDGNALKFIKKTSPDVPDNAGAAVFIEQIITGDGEEQLAAWMEMFEEFGVIEDWSALTDKDRERLRLFRHSLPENVNETMRQRGMKKMGMDLAVPDDRLDDIMKIYAGEGGQTGVEYVLFGHIGDNNLHMNFLPKDESQMETVRAAYLSIAAKAIAMGGTISAEHGVGKKQFPVNGKMTPYLGLMYNEKELQSIATVKKTLDPYMLLNRNNMLPT